ncbi:response regulator transcription factor [Baekduia alba]|uniref:response regulator transcription factor n=1 Tax=Baekduia alba TaxID=2997333 RepID=UPI0023404F50|nr:response regulator transcription factor [Baekduia alba]
MEGPIAIVLADDHAVVRTGLRLVLDAQADFEVVAEAGTVEEAERLTVAMRPAVLVLDLGMPHGAGDRSSLDALPVLARDAPTTKVVVLTMEDDPEYARRALSTGATAYVLKEAAHAELVSAIRHAADGESYLNPRLGAALAATTPGPDPDAPPDDLTERELEVLRLVALGHTNAEVGRLMHLSVRTIEARRAHVQQKIGRSRRPELVRYALERGLLDDVADGAAG